MNDLMPKLRKIHDEMGGASRHQIADQVGVTIQMDGDQAPLSPRGGDAAVESFGETSLESFYDLVSQATSPPPHHINKSRALLSILHTQVSTSLNPRSCR